MIPSRNEEIRPFANFFLVFTSNSFVHLTIFKIPKEIKKMIPTIFKVIVVIGLNLNQEIPVKTVIKYVKSIKEPPNAAAKAGQKPLFILVLKTKIPNGPIGMHIKNPVITPIKRGVKIAPY